MSKSKLYGELYRQGGVSWIFGRRSVRRILDARNKAPGLRSTGQRRHGKILSKQDVARLDWLSRCSPQVMVKVVSRTHNATQLKRHVNYISRNGTLPLESEFGKLQDKEIVSTIRDSWIDRVKMQDAIYKNRRTAVSINLMLSMPAGTDRHQFKRAVRDFVRSEFHGRHETLMAFHDDTDNPHAHIAILSRDNEGNALNANRDRLDRLREKFASCLRDRGIEADATPRHARGVYYKGLHKADYYRSNDSGMSKNRYERLASVYKDLRLGTKPSRSPWDLAIQKKSEAIQYVLGFAAQEPKRSTDPYEREIGDRLESLVQSLKPPRTRNDMVRDFILKNVEIAEQAIRQHGAQYRSSYEQHILPILQREAISNQQKGRAVDLVKPIPRNSEKDMER